MIITMQYPSNLVSAPIIYQLSRQYNIEFSILRAIVEDGFAQLTLEIAGNAEDLQGGLNYLADKGIYVSDNPNISILEDKCVSCGACTAVCSVRALKLDRNSKLEFDKAACINCKRCISTCPLGAIQTVSLQSK